MHPYNTECASNCKTQSQLKKITITNIWHSKPIATFDVLSKWHEPDIRVEIFICSSYVFAPESRKESIWSRLNTYFCFFMLLIYYIYFLCLKKLRQVHCMLKWQACSNTCPGGRMLNLPHLKLRLNLRNNCEIRKWLIANCLQVLWGRPRRLLMSTGQGHPNHRPRRPHSWDLDLPKVAWLLQNLLTYRAVQLKNISNPIGGRP